jgi:uncharacterized protein YggE
MTTTSPARAPEPEVAPPPRAARRPPRHPSAARAAVGAALVVVSVLAAAGCSATQTPPTVNVAAPGPVGTGAPNGITIEGTGEVEGKPDTLTISFGVSVKRDTVDAAVNDNAAVATSVLQALIEQGVEEKDVQTRNYSVQPSFAFTEGQQVPDGYQVTNTVTVQLQDLTGAGASIDAVTAAGGDAVQVQGVAFSLEDDSEVVKAARDQAFADARAKAEQFASLSGRPLGQVESVAETTQTNQDQLYRASASTYAEDATTPISPGEVTTSVTVTVRYALG